MHSKGAVAYISFIILVAHILLLYLLYVSHTVVKCLFEKYTIEKAEI